MIYIHKITGAERFISDYDIEILGPRYHEKLSKFYDLQDDKVCRPEREDSLHTRKNIPTNKTEKGADRATGGAGKDGENTKEKSNKGKTKKNKPKLDTEN